MLALGMANACKSVCSPASDGTAFGTKVATCWQAVKLFYQCIVPVIVTLRQSSASNAAAVC